MINKRNQNHIQMKSLSLILALLLVLSVFGGCGSKETVSTSGSAADSVTDGSASANENEADADAESAEPSGEGTDGDMIFAGGSGSAEDPWKIATAEQLDRIRDDLTGHYILIDDIDLSGYENWMPIGTFQPRSDAPEDAEVPHPDYAFTGTFDGAGHTISNLTISCEAPMGAGLFGCASGTESNAASIGHFTLKDVNVSGFYLVGRCRPAVYELPCFGYPS